MSRNQATEENPDDPEFTPVPDVFQADESDEGMEDVFLPPTLQYIPPAPTEETCSRDSHKYVTLENKFLCRIWLKFPGKATGIFLFFYSSSF